MFWTFLIIILSLILVFMILKPYIIKYDTVIAFTGGLGSGKSLLSSKFALKLLKINRSRTVWYNLFHKSKRPLPLLYSSIPIRIDKNHFSEVLTLEHLTLQSALIERSVVFIDEIGLVASQWEFNNPIIQNNFDTFVRCFRHFTKGGYMVVNDQCSENIVLNVRRRLNNVINLYDFKKILCFYRVRSRNICVSEEIKTVVNDGNTEDSMKNIYGIINPFFRYYDTYCYSEMYKGCPVGNRKKYEVLKKYNFLKIPHKKDYPAPKLDFKDTAQSAD